MRHINTRKLIYNEKYHDNCFDYLKEYYLQRYLLKEYLNFFRDIRENITLLDICDIAPMNIYGDAVVCDQHAVIFTHHKDRYPVLATYALNACIGLLIYEPNLKIGSLAHIDGLPGYSQQSAVRDGIEIFYSPVEYNINTIIKHLIKMCPRDSYEFDYYLVGGIFDMSEIMVYDIVQAIDIIQKQRSHIKFHLKGRNLLGPENQSRNICFDTRTGNLLHFDFIENATYHANNYVDGLPYNIIKAPNKNQALLDITYVAEKLNN